MKMREEEREWNRLWFSGVQGFDYDLQTHLRRLNFQRPVNYRLRMK
ncbi:hypothetical protein HanLR1_Chr00c0654g0766091 [Helianthus annuus]|nr:hypothetical protein HanLR1_Chr00c0654g0766091 [Helianthus annuus]